MSNGRFLLDTNILIAFFSGDSSVEERANRAAALFVPCIVLGELYYGARRSAKAEANLARIDELAATIPVLSCDAATAREYGRVKDSLRTRGRPLPENDIWIAAIASQHDLTVVSRDEHFQEIEGLELESW